MITATENTTPEPNQFEKYRKPIQNIITFTDTIDGEYREKCFEVLLNHYLSGGELTEKNGGSTEAPKDAVFTFENLSSETKVFLEQNNITLQTLEKLFTKEKGEIHPIYKITEPRRAKAQIQIALLTALENALKGASGSFEFSVNTVRQRCMDIKMYDGRDYYINFMDSAGLFGNLNYEVIKLSATGKTELACIVTAFSKQ